MQKFHLIALIFVCALFSSPIASALGDLAASMQPGTWAQLNVANQNAVLSDIGVSGSMVGYSNSMPWNPISKVIEIIGGDHLGATPNVHHVRYNDATNQFTLAQAAPAVPGIGHGYDHNTVNPYTGDLYTRLYGGMSGSISCMKKAYGASSFSGIPGVSAYEQVAIGVCWWSGSFSGGGNQGSFMIFNSGNATGGANDGQILAYNPLSNTWFYNQVGKAPNYGSGSTYHSVIEYSAKKNVAVYGGGNAAPNKLWRLSSDGSVLAMPVVPSGKAVGIQQGVFVDEPVTGNFLLLSAGELWELDPGGSGTWTQKAGPPAGVGVPGATTLAPVASSIPDYGVVAYITQPNQNGGTFYLYKNTSGGNALEAKGVNTEAVALSIQPVPASVAGLIRITPAHPAARYAVYDVRGKMVAELGSKTVWAPRGIRAGLYIIRAQTGSRIISQKLVLE